MRSLARNLKFLISLVLPLYALGIDKSRPNLSIRRVRNVCELAENLRSLAFTWLGRAVTLQFKKMKNARWPNKKFGYSKFLLTFALGATSYTIYLGYVILLHKLI